MSAEWDGNLRNTVTDVIVDTAILILSICSYAPQISRLKRNTYVRGISPYYILFNIFFSNAQLSEVLLCAAYAWPNGSHPVLQQVISGRLEGIQAFGAILGLVQVFVQWSCSIGVLLSFAAAVSNDGAAGRNTSITAFSHAAIVLFPIIAITLPKPSGHTFERDILMSLISMSNRVVAPFFVTLQFFAQYREMRMQQGRPGAFSLLSLGLQVPIMAALAVRWVLRLGNPTWDRNVPAPVQLWYEWAFPAINYAIYALGSAILLACYLLVLRGTAEYDLPEDRQPLLGEARYT